ncbi:haptoglobin [Thalassophryne amazonica]|uniref:haptoglobin n=1 Tax=Thalassophryne amazonica TaxID=390379 RepID=UPI0014721705|nr:haptoglobin [Thalassophryne amazonica]
MWLLQVVFLLAMWACLTDVAQTEGSLLQSIASSMAAQRSRRMVGGILAPHVPWQVMVLLSDSVLDGGHTGGTLIADRWVLTAGRNLFAKKRRQDNLGKSPAIPKVYVGITEQAEMNTTTEAEVDKVFLHPGFQNKSDWDNDLALIQLKEPVIVGERVTPLPLPERGQDLADTEGTLGAISGWGFGAYFTSAKSLKHLVVPVVSQASCTKEFEHLCPTAPVVDNNTFCTGSTIYSENVCIGDAGGAFAVKDPNTGTVYAAGILSYDQPCRVHKFAVFMKLSSYLSWIHSVIRGDTESSFAVRSNAMAQMLKSL